MPLVTNIIDDKSPLILYDATWIPGSSQGDTFTSEYVPWTCPRRLLDALTHSFHSYYLGTFATNNVTDGSATFNFNGTAIWIYGANRPNHGTYSVQVDSATFSNLNGAANNLFQQSIFNMSTLSQGMHSLKLTNTGSEGQYVDIDMVSRRLPTSAQALNVPQIVWQSQVGDENDQLVIETVQDTDSRFQYQEPAWSTTSSAINFGLFSNGTGQ